MDATTIVRWLEELGTSVTAERERLTQLDSAIGDGDHGTNMHRGLTAVGAVLAEQAEGQPPGRVLVLAGKTLVSKVGGASGPLWGTALRRAGKALGDAPAFDGAELATALEAAVAGVVELGAASPGDKTMVDALGPGVEALRAAVDQGRPVAEAVREAAEAAEAGVAATIPMQARKGRASYLGERSVGHQDPGATSVALALRALERAVAQEA